MMISNLAVALGGRVAEEVIFGNEKVTTGAYSDIKYATSIARNMVTKLGFSKKIGLMLIEEHDNQTGYSTDRKQLISENLAQEIDNEVKQILFNAYNSAKNILKKNLYDLHLLANSLIEYETLSGYEVKNLIRKKKIFRYLNNKDVTNKFKTSINIDIIKL